MDRPDSRIFASYPMPAKIDLLNERPRRESQVERQLADQIGQQISPTVPRITVSSEQQNFTNASARAASPMSQQQQRGWSSSNNSTQELETVRSLSGSRSPSGRTEIKETRIIINQHSAPSIVSSTSHFEGPQVDEGGHALIRRSVSPQPQASTPQQQFAHQQHQQQQQYYGEGSPLSSNQQERQTRTVTTTTTTTTNQQQQQQQQKNQQQQEPHVRQPSLNPALNKTISDNAALLALELAEKEAKLMREITALHQRPYSPYQTPAKIDLTNESRAAQVQQSHMPPPSPQMQGTLNSRPNSRASSRSQTSQMDLMEKEAKLLREIEEIEAKPYNPQTMLVEREQWFEYPPGARPSERHLTESTRRVRDFCSLPRNLCQDRHVHEENLPARVPIGPTPGSIHTTIIRSPAREIDNKSPLPFAFDNFTTKGVRGNIASANAVEPDRPRPPIFPIVKRSPSPNVAH